MPQPDTSPRGRLFDELTDPKEWDADLIGLPEAQANALIDAYRDQAVAEAAAPAELATLRRIVARFIYSSNEGDDLNASDLAWQLQSEGVGVQAELDAIAAASLEADRA